MTARPASPPCDAATRPVAYAICKRVYRDCICERQKKDPCDAMVLAACDAERAIEAREGAA